MKTTNSLPPVKIKLTSFDWATELLALMFLILLTALPFIFLNDLPERIPVHFNAAGSPDGYGSRSTLWILPVTGAFMYLLLTAIAAFPQIYNFPVKITPENVVTQYRLATRLIRILKAAIMILFSFLSYQTLRTATGDSAGLGKAFLPVFLLITSGVIIVYFVMSLNNRHSS